MVVDAAHQVLNMTADFVSGRRRAGPEHNSDGARRGDNMDVDWHETTLVVVGIEER